VGFLALASPTSTDTMPGKSWENDVVRIVHVCRQYSPSIGGMETVVEVLARQQAANGHHVRVVTLNRVFGENGPPLPRREMRDDVEIVRIPFTGSHRYPIAPSVLRHIKDAGIVHVHGIDFFFDFLALTRPLHGRTLVATTHGGFNHTDFAKRLKQVWFGSITRTSVRAYDALLACSHADEAEFRKLAPPALQLLENGVDTAKFRDMAASDRPGMLYFGRLAPNKGLDRLLRWFAEVRKLDSQWTLTIAGRSTEQVVAHLRSLGDELGLGEALAIVPSPSDEELKGLIAGSSVYACASQHEGFGIAAIEGASAGLFPVLSRIPAFSDTVRQIGDGLLLDFDDASGAAHRFLAEWPAWSAARRATMIERTAAAYDWSAIGAHLESIYADLANDRVPIGPVGVEPMTFEDALERVRSGLHARRSMTVAFCNAHSVNTARGDAAFSDAMGSAMVLNDGIGLDLAGKLLFGHPFPANLNGTDFTPQLLAHEDQPLRIFLLGSAPGVAERAGVAIKQRYPQHQIVGTHHGFYPASEDAAVTASIIAAKPDLILVGMGQPRQELWAAAHAGRIPGVIMCIGAFLDFTAGVVTRAPRWVQRIRLEWAYRLVQEPRRLARRYLIGNLAFLTFIIYQRLFGAPVRRRIARVS